MRTAESIVRLGFIIGCLCIMSSAGAEPIKRMAYPAISPDGSLIAFSYHEDLWTVPADGGTAQRLTVHTAPDIAPVFSPDGKMIAFASARFGNYDIYVVPTDGGQPTRLTYHSSSDIPCEFTPDGQWLLFYSWRLGSTDLWKIPVSGGTAIRLTDYLFESEYWGSVSPDAKRIAFCANGGRGEWRRPGYRSSSNADIWIADFGTPLSGWVRLTDHLGDDYWPMWSEDGKTLYYVTDGGGDTLNIWRMRPDGREKHPVTTHIGDRVRYPSISRQGDRIAYVYDSELWLCDARSGDTRKLTIEIADDDRTNPDLFESYTGDCTEFSVSPDGKLVAFTVRGEVFLTSTDKGGRANRITDTPWREAGVDWSPDSTRLVYSSDRSGNRDLYLSDLRGNETQLTDDPGDETHPLWSPDGKWIAYHSGEREIRIVHPNGSGARTVVAGSFPEIGRWSGGRFDWSPDSEWIVYSSTDPTYHSSGYAQRLDGSEPIRLTNSAGGVFAVQWSQSMDQIYYQSSHYGNWDIWTTSFLDKPIKFDEDPLDKLINREGEAPAEPPESSKPSKPEKPPKPELDFTDIIDRGERVTTHEEDDFAPILTPDGKTFVFVSRRDGTQIWTIPAEEPSPSAAKKLTSSRGGKDNLQLTSDGKRCYYLEDGEIKWVQVDGKKSGDVKFRADMTIDFDTENLQVFNEAWWVLDRYYYDIEHHGRDWGAIKDKYRPLLRYCAAKGEVADILNEMIGEINSSHVGASPPRSSGGPRENTGYLGIVFDYDLIEREGLFKVTDVVPDMPADNPHSRIRPGDYVLDVDGVALDASVNFDGLLRNKVGRKVILKVAALRPDGRVRDVAIKPVDAGALSEARYEWWVKRNREMIHRLSDGRIGYMHIRGMGSANVDQLERELVTEAMGRDALILDVRNNGGGSTAHEILGILQKKPFLIRQVGDFEQISETVYRGIGFEGPKALLINQHSFSNAEIFAEGFRELKLGPVVGETTAGGCIGTGGHTLIDGSSIRTPVIGAYTLRNEDLEGNGRKPDIRVPFLPPDAAAGRDPQIEAAVRALMPTLR